MRKKTTIRHIDLDVWLHPTDSGEWHFLVLRGLFPILEGEKHSPMECLVAVLSWASQEGWELGWIREVSPDEAAAASN